MQLSSAAKRSTAIIEFKLARGNSVATTAETALTQANDYFRQLHHRNPALFDSYVLIGMSVEKLAGQEGDAAGRIRFKVNSKEQLHRRMEHGQMDCVCP